MRVLDQPSALGELALLMPTAGINIDSVYVTTTGTSSWAWTISRAQLT